MSSIQRPVASVLTQSVPTQSGLTRKDTPQQNGLERNSLEQSQSERKPFNKFWIEERVIRLALLVLRTFLLKAFSTDRQSYAIDRPQPIHDFNHFAMRHRFVCINHH